MTERLATPAAGLVRLPMQHPGDVPTDLASVLPGVEPGRVRAVIVKSEGNGCVNDFSRTLASGEWHRQLPHAVTVVSGGTEGVLSPHATLLYDETPVEAGPGDLVLGTRATPTIDWADLGSEAHAFVVAETVLAIQADLGVTGGDVVFCLVKCPLLTKDRIESVRARGLTVRTEDPYETMADSRAASAVGVGFALGELDAAQVASGVAGDRSVWSAVASASAGAELDTCKIIVLARKAGSGGRLRATNVVMRDALDCDELLGTIADIRSRGGSIRQVFAKADPDPTGSIRGRRHTMLTDSDIHSTRHARAAIGGLLAGLAGDPMIYVSGGAENQGPPGGGPVVVVWEAPDGPPAD